MLSLKIGSIVSENLAGLAVDNTISVIFCLFLSFKKLSFLDLNSSQIRSTGGQRRVPKSIIILGRKQEGPGLRKRSSTIKLQTLSIDLLEPRGRWGEQFLMKRQL